MTEPIPQLVSLYAAHDVAQIRKNPALLQNAFGKPPEQLAQEWRFSQDQQFVEDLKLKIESRKERLSTPDKKAQIAECLKILLNLVMYDKSAPSMVDLKMETMRELFLQRIPPNHWSQPQQEHFDYICNLLKEWNSYFLSYTNDGAKGINGTFASVIERCVDQDELEKRDRNRHNILADAIVNRLRKHNLRRRFYDKENIKQGDNLREKIAPACKKVFAFVQLIQLETFDAIDEVNWCFEEYQIFLQANEWELTSHEKYRQVFQKRFNAVLTGKDEKDLIPAGRPFEYDPWVERIFRQQLFTALPSVPDEFNTAINELANEIVHLKYQIIENVPT